MTGSLFSGGCVGSGWRLFEVKVADCVVDNSTFVTEVWGEPAARVGSAIVEENLTAVTPEDNGFSGTDVVSNGWLRDRAMVLVENVVGIGTLEEGVVGIGGIIEAKVDVGSSDFEMTNVPGFDCWLLLVRIGGEEVVVPSPFLLLTMAKFCENTRSTTSLVKS